MPELGVSLDVECVRSTNYYFREKLGLYDLESMNKLYRKFYRQVIKFMNKRNSLSLMSNNNYDIVHPTYYDNYILKRKHGKLVITVHDMIHERFADSYMSRDKITIPSKKRLLYAADTIIAISESTKQDMLYLYPDLNADKIRVIYHGVSLQNNRGESPLPGQDYILFVGNRGSYKNFSRFVKAVTPILESHKDLQVFCAGGGAFTSSEIDSFGKNKSRFHQSGLSDNSLAGAYSNALCFVFPSEYEGFGIPLLESFTCNCPVVCSDSSSFPEVAENAAEYFNPLDIDDMSHKILRVIQDKDLQESLKSRGIERAKFFSWDKAASETLDCYKFAKEV